jgi:hypothetical protein
MSEQSNVPRNTGVEEDVRGEGEGRRRADEATPKIADDAAKEQTAVPAPSDDASHRQDEHSEETKDPHP